MRVLYVLNAPGGGATQGIIEMLRGLQGQHEAFIVVPQTPNERQRQCFAKLATETFVVPMHWWNRKTSIPLLWRVLVWGRSNLRDWGHLRSTMSLIRLMRTYQIELVYTNTAMMLDGALAARWCKLPHLWHVKEWIGQTARVKFWLPDALLTRFIAEMSNRILVMSRFIGEIFNRYGLNDQLELINDGVNLQDYQGDLGGRELRRQFNITDDQFLVGMAASLSSTWKKHEIFTKMATRLAKQYPQVRFIAFGPEPKHHRNPAYNRPWNYYQNLRRMVKEQGLSQHFTWAGFHSNIPQMMDAMDVLVHPCDIEPFGRVAIEAMAACTPVVGPNRGGIAESVKNGKTGFLVRPDDSGAFADAASQFIQDRELCYRFGAAGRDHVASHFSLSSHVQQITELFEQVYEEADRSRTK